MIPANSPLRSDRDSVRLDAARVLEASGALIERYQLRRPRYRKWALRAQGFLSELNRDFGAQRIDGRSMFTARQRLAVAPIPRLAAPSVGHTTLYQTTGECRLYLR